MDFNFTSQICTTKEQSKRLLDLGLKRETADMHHYKWSEGYWDIQACPVRGTEPCYIPAWSLHRLLCLLPTEYTYDIDFQQIMQDFVFGSQDMYDEVVSCIETLIEAGYLYQEYLEE